SQPLLFFPLTPRPRRNATERENQILADSNPIQSKAEVEIKPTGDEVLLGVRPVAGVLPPGVGPHLALHRRLRRHGGRHHQDDRRLHRGGPQELQVRPGAQEEVVTAARSQGQQLSYRHVSLMRRASPHPHYCD
uniref:Uncharacterized protein n=1 Tax=Triticum urartu TaxID=4572 RepID=A0A8R7P5H4_TRIUA